MDSLGKSARKALTTVNPPMPESKTPIGRVARVDTLSAMGLVAAGDGNGRRMIPGSNRRLGSQRFADGMGVRREAHLGDGKVRALCPIIHRGIVILDALRDGCAEP